MFDYDRLYELSKKNGLSYAFLASQIGKWRGYFHDCQKNGTTIPDIYQRKIAELLHTTVDYLNGADDTPAAPATVEETVEIVKLINSRPVVRELFSAVKDVSDGELRRALAIINVLKNDDA